MSVFCTVLLGVGFSSLAIIPSTGLQYVAFILSAVHRSFVFGCNASFIAIVLPMEHFGKLYGIAQVWPKIKN